MAVAGWDAGLPRKLAVGTQHIDPFAVGTRGLAEAQDGRWTALRYGDRDRDDHYYAIWAADLNSPPLFGPPADVSRMNVLDRAGRFRDPPECTIPNTDIAEAFADVGFVDTAEILYEKDKDERHLAMTGRSDRIDRQLVTERVVPAVIGGELLDSPDRAANHHGLKRIYDLARIRTA